PRHVEDRAARDLDRLPIQQDAGLDPIGAAICQVEGTDAVAVITIGDTVNRTAIGNGQARHRYGGQAARQDIDSLRRDAVVVRIVVAEHDNAERCADDAALLDNRRGEREAAERGQRCVRDRIGAAADGQRGRLIGLRCREIALPGGDDRDSACGRIDLGCDESEIPVGR
ncbi:hypothetical protein chiPu_0033702, partial [Chiloscyllium punctatum]|nr:hypothetical protein [Chiloscyllium punctatum]